MIVASRNAKYIFLFVEPSPSVLVRGATEQQSVRTVRKVMVHRTATVWAYTAQPSTQPVSCTVLFVDELEIPYILILNLSLKMYA